VDQVRTKYEELMAASNAKYQLATDEANKHTDYDSYKRYTEEAWALSKEAMTYFDKLPQAEQDEIKASCVGRMYGGFVRGLFSGGKPLSVGVPNH
jgi:hypothetical protein